MWRRVNQILNILMGSIVGVFIGYSLYRYWEYKTHPELYVLYSAPWYTEVLLYGGVAAVILLMIMIVKLIIRKKRKEGDLT